MHLEVKDLKVFFKGSGKTEKIRAVNGVSLDVQSGESVGLVGESGCGKSSLANAITGLVPVSGGSILLDGEAMTNSHGKVLTRFRKKIQMVFQDPFSSLNPRLTIGSCLAEVCRVHSSGADKSGISARVADLMEMVGLDAGYVDRYPHEFSGGQRQRIGIARALAVNPSLIIADEPVSALDVSVQVQILNLLKSLQEKMNLAYLFIAHDLAVVKYMCERINVMYLGQIVESGRNSDIFDYTSHPYTEALLSAVPDVEKGLKSRESMSERIVLKGDVPSPSAIIPGCPFHPRCHRVKDKCLKDVPPRVELSDGHFSVCHFACELNHR